VIHTREELAEDAGVALWFLSLFDAHCGGVDDFEGLANSLVMDDLLDLWSNSSFSIPKTSVVGDGFESLVDQYHVV